MSLSVLSSLTTGSSTPLPSRRAIAASPAASVHAAATALPPPPNPVAVVRGIQLAILRAAVLLVNNTPLRNVFEKLIPPITLPQTTGIRLIGVPTGFALSNAPPSTVLSPDGTQLYQVTVPIIASGFFGWHSPSYSTLTVIDAKTNAVVGHPINFQGEPAGPLVVSPDGTRVYMTSTVWSGGSAVASYVTTIDTSTATVVGTPVKFAGWTFGGPVLSPDGSRLYQATSAVGFTQTITAIDTATGTVAGTPLILSGGGVVGGLVLSSDGSRLSLTTQTANLADGKPQTVYIAVVDAADISLISRVTLTGAAAGGVVMSPDSTGAAQAVTLGTTTSITYIDLTDGSVAWTATADGSSIYSVYAPMFSDNGSRVSVITAENSSPRVTVYDTSNGDVVGTLALPGATTGETTALVPDPSGNRLFVAAGAYTGPTFVTVVDTSNGIMVGDPVSVPGFGRLVASADGSSVYLPTIAGDYPNTSKFVVINGEGVVTGTADMPGGIGHVLVGPGDGRVYLLNSTDERRQLIALDAVTAAILGPAIALDGWKSYDLVLNPDGTKIYDTTVADNTQPNFWSLLTSLYVTRVAVLDTAAI
ncbi:hypothetical protein [Mycobacterium sp. RTGN5]|uniref:hypothetical protein n=1 Tax=Mycobacterium sp. RTGN5 TaxID=3016522 RepID=UPI0029C8543E|nr:hypothetical protein [Mycobacterium sp. RTGN5]